jgi:hypothetical protein
MRATADPPTPHLGIAIQFDEGGLAQRVEPSQRVPRLKDRTPERGPHAAARFAQSSAAGPDRSDRPRLSQAAEGFAGFDHRSGLLTLANQQPSKNQAGSPPRRSRLECQGPSLGLAQEYEGLIGASKSPQGFAFDALGVDRRVDEQLRPRVPRDLDCVAEASSSERQLCLGDERSPCVFDTLARASDGLSQMLFGRLVITDLHQAGSGRERDSRGPLGGRRFDAHRAEPHDPGGVAEGGEAGSKRVTRSPDQGDGFAEASHSQTPREETAQEIRAIGGGLWA